MTLSEDQHIAELIHYNLRLQEEVKQLRQKLSKLTAAENGVAASAQSHNGQHSSSSPNSDGPAHPAWEGVQHSLSKGQVERYSRQILLHSFGVQAQDRLCRSSALVIGAGGLGCPAAIYLAAAGVGRLGIVDKDSVETSNLHRQVLHPEANVGRHKAESASAACQALNSTIEVVAYTEGFFPANALQLVSQYDVVVDASDNAPTRYLISDACCVLGKPLVSGAAIGTDGQLTIYHHNGGPCYRCLFPDPPQPETCSRCSEAGVLGPVPGLIGTLQALEAVKILSGVGTTLSQKLLLVDCLSGRFTSVKLRPRQQDCPACGSAPSITAATLPAFDYASFTGQSYDDRGSEELQLLPADQRVTAHEFLPATQTGRVIVDVRPALQYEAAHLPGSVHLPFDEHHPERFEAALEAAVSQGRSLGQSKSVAVVCRKGNDSQRAVELMRQRFNLDAVDLEGGLLAWSKLADPAFPAL